MGCSPSHQVVPSPGRTMATFPLRPSFHYNERLLVYADDVTGLEAITPPQQPSRNKKDVFDLDKFVDIDHRATMAPDSLLHQPYVKLMEFLLTGLKDDMSKVRMIFRWVTAQPLDHMKIPQEPDSDIPLHQFWRIQQGKGNYAQLILTLCRLAGIPCVIINGLMKGSTYSIGQKVTNDQLYGEWNAVLVDNDWRFLNAYWGACGEGDEDEEDVVKTKSRSKKKKAVYSCDENYFLTDPEHLSSSHFPFVEAWQLLDEPLSLQRFEEMAFLKDRFFNLNMSLVTHDKCIVRSLNGDVDFRFQIPTENSVNLKFRHILSRLQSPTVPSVGGDVVWQNQYVFVHKVQADILSVEVRFPVAGVYRLELVGKDASIEQAGYDYDWIVLYKIVVDKGLAQCKPFPMTLPAGWGPGYEASRLGLSPLSHKTGHVKTLSGEAEIRFKVGKATSQTVNFSHLLSADSVEDESLVDYVVHWMDVDDVVFFIRTPTKGEYGLSLFATPAGKNVEKENFCNYLITSAQSGKHEKFPRDFGDGAGPRDGLAGMGVRLVSHNAPVIYCNKEELKVIFELKQSIELFAALSGVGLKAADSKRLVKQYTRGKYVHFTIRMPAQGSYGLKVVGMDPTAAKTFQNVYDYLIEFKKGTKIKMEETILEEAEPEPMQRQESLISIISDLNENSSVIEIGQPPTIEEVKIPEEDTPDHTEAPNREIPTPIITDPRVGRIQQKMRQAVKENDEAALETAIAEMRGLNVLYTAAEEKRAQLDLNVMRTKREILAACHSGDQAQLHTALDHLTQRELQGVLRKEMLRAQRLIDRHNNIMNNLHDVMDLDYKTLAEIKSFSAPPEIVKRTMMAAFLLMGHYEEETENWRNVCLQLSRIGNDSFKNRMQELDPATIPLDIALGAKDHLKDITLERVWCVSAGAAAFYKWTQGIIEEVEDRHGDEARNVKPRKRKSPTESTPSETA